MKLCNLIKGKGYWGKFLDDGNVPYLDWGSGYI